MIVIPLTQYEKRVKQLLSVLERQAMEASLAANPLAYPVIAGTGGFRKARWARGNRGK